MYTVQGPSVQAMLCLVGIEGGVVEESSSVVQRRLVMNTSCLCLVSLVTRFRGYGHITACCATATLTTPGSVGAVAVCTSLLLCQPTKHTQFMIPSAKGTREWIY